MNRPQKDARQIWKAFEVKRLELERAIEFRKHSVEYDKKWIEKGTPETIDLLLNDLVQHQTEVKILEAMLKAVNELRAEEMRKAAKKIQEVLSWTEKEEK